MTNGIQKPAHVRNIVIACGRASVIATAVVTLSSTAALPPAPTEDSTFYYEIGGAQPISLSPNPDVTSMNLSAAASVGMGYSCLKFDPLLGVTNTLNEVRNGAENMTNAMVSAATSAIASLPAYILHRANPDLYDLFQNALLMAREGVSLATKSCQQMEQEVRRGENPYEDVATIAIGDDWKRQMGTGGLFSSSVDVIQAEKNVAANAGRNGIPWPVPGGRAGGAAQPMIEPAADAMFAGWNITMNRVPSASGPVYGSTAPLVRYWASPEAAHDWILKVIGDVQATSFGGGEKKSIPGQGLAPELDANAKTVQPELAALVFGTRAPTRTNLERVSAPDLAITRQVIESMRNLPAADRDITVGRIANEVAMARVIDKALMARQLIQTGRQEPNIVATESLQGIIGKAVSQLDQAIENLLFENRIRQEVISITVRQVLKYDSARRNRATQTQGASRGDNRPLNGGAVR